MSRPLAGLRAIRGRYFGFGLRTQYFLIHQFHYALSTDSVSREHLRLPRPDQTHRSSSHRWCPGVKNLFWTNLLAKLTFPDLKLQAGKSKEAEGGAAAEDRKCLAEDRY